MTPEQPPHAPEVAQAEVAEYLESRVVRRRLFPRAILAGVASGTVAAAFRFTLERTEVLRERIIDLLNGPLVIQALGVAAFAALGCLIASQIGKFDKDSGGSGIPHMKAVLEGHSTMTWGRLIIVKFVAAVAAIGSGLALGREGPTVQMGGAAGIAVAEATGASGREKRALAAAGAGAGLAAAFNAPLAGVTFVLEELQRDFQPVVFGAALMSAAIATVISRLASGQVPAFLVPHVESPSLSFFPEFVVIGLLSGLVGIVFNRGLLNASALLEPLRQNRPVLVALGVGVLAGITFLVSPQLLGGGHGLTESAIHGSILLGPAAAYLLTRLFFVHISYATGVPGGIFAPLLSLGALLGVILYHSTHQFLPNCPSVAACAVAGMCGLFSGVVRAPLTGIILIAEMTGSYDLLLPLLAASFTAYAVAEGLGDTPIYEALLQRDAVKKGWNLEHGELITAEFEVRPGSKFDGKPIRDLGLPQGVLIVLCRAEGKEVVPRATTILHSHMRVVVVAGSSRGVQAVEAGTGNARERETK